MKRADQVLVKVNRKNMVRAIEKGDFEIDERANGEKQLLIRFTSPVGKAVDGYGVESDSGLVRVCMSKKNGWHHFLIPEDNGNDRFTWADSVWFKDFHDE